MIRGIPSDDLTEKTLSLWRGGFLVDTRIMSVRVIFDRKLYREPCQFEPARRPPERNGQGRQVVFPKKLYREPCACTLLDTSRRSVGILEVTLPHLNPVSSSDFRQKIVS